MPMRTFLFWILLAILFYFTVGNAGHGDFSEIPGMMQ